MDIIHVEVWCTILFYSNTLRLLSCYTLIVFALLLWSLSGNARHILQQGRKVCDQKNKKKKIRQWSEETLVNQACDVIYNR